MIGDTRRPVRLRLTLAFTAGLALVLLALGVFVYQRTGAVLLAQIDAALLSQAELVTADVQARGPVLADIQASLIERDEDFAQIADQSGRIVQSSSIVSGRPLLPAATLRSLEHATLFNRVVPGIDDVTRVLAVPIQTSDGRLVVMVASSLQDRRDELLGLAWTLVIGGTVALGAMALGAWIVVGAALRPVEEAIEREQRLVDRASHELRTPLAVQRMDLDLALSGPQTVPELGAALRSASEENDHLTRLADDLLILSRARGGELTVSPVDVPASDLLDAAVERSARRARETSTTLTARGTTDRVRADPAWIRQALDNLVGNALRCTPPGGRVELRAERDDGVIRLVVQDTGPGYPESVLAHAFEPFTRAAGIEPGGAGLGLPVVLSIARAHGGTALIENPPGGGARATLILQAAPGTGR